MRYLLLLLVTIAACFGLQSLALHAAGGRTTKSESNYFSSIARIQNGLRSHPEILLLGSSRMARLPDITGRTDRIVNMGCDGGSATITLRAIECGILPAAPVIVIEGNTLLHDLERRGHEISEAMESPWFDLGNRLPLVSATARPSAFVYSALLGRRTAKSSPQDGPLLPVSTIPEFQEHAIPLPTDANALVQELSGILKRLHERNIKLMIVMLPPAFPPGSLNVTIPQELSRISGIPILNLTRDLPTDAVQYTDGIHMAPASAASAQRTIRKALENL